jgi:hypothetical protein
MSEYITTYTGIHFYPTEPKIEDIEIKDIAHSLSLICRGNGQVQSFFSVGQHCILCAKEAAASGLSNRIVLACLLHDASECYLSDVPRPFKKTLVGYDELENKILNLIYEKYLGSVLTNCEAKELKKIDDSVLYYDMINLLNEPQDGPAPDLHVNPDYTVRPFIEVENEYLKLFNIYALRST